MKREFLNQTKLAAVPFSIAIALSLAIGTATVSHADSQSLWNPKNWFNTAAVSPSTAPAQNSDDAVSNAKRKADEAQQAATQALQAAQQAQEQAAEAQRQAQALEKSAHHHKKHPIVTAPTEAKDAQASNPSATGTEAVSSDADKERQPQRVYESNNSQAESNAAAAEKPSATQATAQTDKKEPWNPLNWFHKDEDKATGLDGGIPHEKAFQDATKAEAAQSTASSSESNAKQESQPTESATASQKTDATAAESTQSQAHGSWTLKNLFKKPTTQADRPTEASPKTEAAEKTASQPEVKAEESAADKTTQTTEQTSEDKSDKQAISSETPNTTKSKSGGWNLLNLISKPSIPLKAQGIAPDTKETDKVPQPESAETEQAIKTKAALIETERGNIAIELYPDQAPQTVANFVKLINEGFYNRYNMKFHRVVPGFVVQTGDPTGTGAGGSKQRVPLEAKNKLSHNVKGVVAMARGADPDSATSQFYITLAPQISLDGKYAIFGRVISGIDILSKIEKDDMLYGIRLVDLSSVVRDPQPEKKKFFSSLF